MPKAYTELAQKEWSRESYSLTNSIKNAIDKKITTFYRTVYVSRSYFVPYLLRVSTYWLSTLRPYPSAFKSVSSSRAPMLLELPHLTFTLSSRSIPHYLKIRTRYIVCGGSLSASAELTFPLILDGCTAFPSKHIEVLYFNVSICFNIKLDTTFYKISA